MREINFHGYIIKEDGTLLNKDGSPKAIGKQRKNYCQVSFWIDGRPVTYRWARLLATLFIPNPEGLSDVDHIDADRDNNSLDNLRWVSHGDNIRHSYALGNRCAKGANNANAKLSEEDVHTICKLIVEGRGHTEIERMTGFSKASCLNIKKRRHWKVISDHYVW